VQSQKVAKLFARLRNFFALRRTVLRSTAIASFSYSKTPSAIEDVVQSAQRALQRKLVLPLCGFCGRRHIVDWLLRLAEVLRHLEMMLESRERLAGPILQLGILTTLGIALEQ
jgi:hypothetical protein